MALTLLDAVNNVLKRVNVIKGDAGDLTSLTDSARQTDIDLAVIAWNDFVMDMYARNLFSQGTDTSSFILADGIREYDLATDFEQFAADTMRNESDYYTLRPYQGGYEQMWDDQTNPAGWTGVPLAYAINTSTNKIRIDRTPTSEEVGLQFDYLYQKRLALTLAADTFPFSDTAVDMGGIAVAELWKRYRKLDVDSQILRRGVASVAAYLHQDKRQKRYA